jgi:hypothetical protein
VSKGGYFIIFSRFFQRTETIDRGYTREELEHEAEVVREKLM